MFTSCCPAWVKFVSQCHPNLKPHLTTACSPHIHSAIAYKTWWAEKEKIDPKNIVVISVMPCTAKRHEITKKTLDGMPTVDYVLNIRELAQLVKDFNIDFQSLDDSDSDLCG